ncbi:hypothetical protein BZG02_20620 [Labilibaculum filiforme]|uniref:Uncharacterized protein n=1 Tax=Labilibaculum filiforme TaxID=1940526 RepID=A0A2N3HPZ4_9BACT|nr:hypothetical protein [Labilibaculum filiforme]PKQ60132.1 hypothetical protein BZG02_20620 [Labilibaculum filiforme]
MKNKDPKEIQEVRDYQRKFLSKTRIIIGILILFIGLSVSLVKRTSLTLLRIKCFEISGFETTLGKSDSILITKSMINSALNVNSIDKNKFDQGYIPYLYGDYYPLFSTDYSIKEPMFLTNYFSKGDIGFIKKKRNSDTATVEIFRHSFDFFRPQKVEVDLSQLDSIEDYEIKYFPDRLIVINNIDTIKLISVEEFNTRIKKLNDEY